jgi:RNA 3'-terminal phosphate cyclase (ATP)
VLFLTIKMTELLLIDGSEGEGGGQVLRTSLSLSALTGRPFRIENIRANRSRPGLRPQHLTAVHAVAALCKAELVGDEIGKTVLEFRPTTRPTGGFYEIDVTKASESGQSAGAVALVFEAILWPLLFASEPTNLILKGGTFVPFSPAYHYLAEVARPAFQRFGADFSTDLRKWGWMAAGGGVVEGLINPISGLSGVMFEPILAETISGVAAVTNLPSHIPHRMARRAHNLIEDMGLKAAVSAVRERGAGAGAGITLWQAQAGFSAIGRRGWPADKVAEAAVADLVAFLDNGAAVDKYLADQLLIPMSLAQGRSSLTTNHLTQHTLTNSSLLRQWLDVSIQINGELGQTAEIVVDGFGYKN